MAAPRRRRVEWTEVMGIVFLLVRYGRL